MRYRNIIFHVSVLFLPLFAAGCSQTKLGGDQGAPGVSGSAGPAGAQNAAAELERCDHQLGIITLVESQDATFKITLQQLGLSSPIPVVKLIAKQSGCFRVVDRGVAMQTMQQERQLSQQGETRAGSNLGGGQMVTPDLAVTVDVLWKGDTGGGGGGVGAIGGGGWGAIAGAIAGGFKSSSAQAMMTLTDVRSSEDVSIAQGTATSNDFSIGTALFGGTWGGGGGAAFGAYSSTPEGKTVTAALVDAYNNVVRSVRAMPPLPSMAQASATAAPGVQKGWIVNGNIMLRETPDKNGAVLGRLTPGTVVVPTGESKNGWMKVASGDTVGWVFAQNLHQQQ